MARKCPKCQERQLNLVTEKYEAILEHDGREYKIGIHDLVLLACSACQNRMVPYESEDRLSQELRHVSGLLSPMEIREKRNQLKLTQKQLVQYLDISEYTLSRWETGAQIQQRGFDKLLRLYFDLSIVRNYLSQRKELESTSHSNPEKTPRLLEQIVE